MVSNTWASYLAEPSVNQRSRNGSSSAGARVAFGRRLTWSDRSPWFEDDEGALFGSEPLIRCRDGVSTRVAKGVEESKNLSWT